MFENWPYADLHDLNLDWIIQEIKKQKTFFDTQLIPLIEEKVSEIAVNMVISYDPDTETLTFTLGGADNG